MTNYIHWRLSSENKIDQSKSLPFDGPALSLQYVQREIEVKLAKGQRGAKSKGSVPYRLTFKNSVTGEDYTSPDQLIPRNTVVVVRRVFTSRQDALSFAKTEEELAVASPLQKPSENDGDFAEEKEPEMLKMQQAMEKMEQQQPARQHSIQQQTAQRTRPMLPNKCPPPGYVCRKCGVPGHYILHCPGKIGAVSSSSPLPARAQPPRTLPPNYVCRICNIPGHHIQDCPTRQTRFALKNANLKPVEELKIVSAPTQQERESKKISNVPDHLSCFKCRQLLQMAVMIGCCGTSFCNECIRVAIVTDHLCPCCQTAHDDDALLKHNVRLRQMALEWSQKNSAAPALPIPPRSASILSPIPSPASPVVLPPFRPPIPAPLPTAIPARSPPISVVVRPARSSPIPVADFSSTSSAFPIVSRKRTLSVSNIVNCGQCGDEGHVSQMCPQNRKRARF